MDATRTMPEAKLWDLIADIRTVMLATYNDSRVESRPMTAFVDKDARTIWFIVDVTTDKTRAIKPGQQVNLAFADIKDATYISLNANATVLQDVAKQKALWNPFAEAYMPEGPEAPNVGLIRIDPIDAAYWDSPSSTIVQLWQIAVANVTQTPPEDDKTGLVRFA